MKRLILAGFLIAAPAYAADPTERFFDSTGYTLVIAQNVGLARACGFRPSIWAANEMSAMISAIYATAENIWSTDAKDQINSPGDAAEIKQAANLQTAYRAGFDMPAGACTGFEVSGVLPNLDKIIGWTAGATDPANQ